MQQNHCHIRFQHAHGSFNLIAIETAGTWNAMAVELVQKIGRRIIVSTQQPKETTFSFQRLSTALQQGNAVSFQNTMTSKYIRRGSRCMLFINFHAMQAYFLD